MNIFLRMLYITDRYIYKEYQRLALDKSELKVKNMCSDEGFCPHKFWKVEDEQGNKKASITCQKTNDSCAYPN